MGVGSRELSLRPYRCSQRLGRQEVSDAVLLASPIDILHALDFFLLLAFLLASSQLFSAATHDILRILPIPICHPHTHILAPHITSPSRTSLPCLSMFPGLSLYSRFFFLTQPIHCMITNARAKTTGFPIYMFHTQPPTHISYAQFHSSVLISIGFPTLFFFSFLLLSSFSLPRL